MTGAVSSHRVQLQAGDGASPEVFNRICEILNFNGPSETAPQIDVTSLCSDAREYIGGLKDGGEVGFDLNFVPGDPMQYQLRDDLNNGTVRNYQIVIEGASPTTTIGFAAIVTAFSLTGAVDQAVQASASLKITGQVTYTG